MFLDLDSQLAELKATEDEPITVRLGGVDHDVVRMPMLDLMRLGRKFIGKDGKDSLDASQVADLADLLLQLLPTAADYLRTLNSAEALLLILKACLDAINEPSPSPGRAEGNASTLPEAQSPVASVPTPAPSALTLPES